jgi:hypothetical protein
MSARGNVRGQRQVALLASEHGRSFIATVRASEIDVSKPSLFYADFRKPCRHGADRPLRRSEQARQPLCRPALKGAELCLAHSGQTRLDSVKGAQRSAEVRRAKAQARRETLQDKLARKLDEHADEIVAAYLAGIRSDDPNRAYRAADAWISRVHGRPKETVENVTVPDDPLDIASTTREERDRLKRHLVAANPEAARQLGLTIAR